MNEPKVGSREFEALVKSEAFDAVTDEEREWLLSPAMRAQTLKTQRAILGKVNAQLHARVDDTGEDAAAWRRKAVAVRCHLEQRIDQLEGDGGRTHRLERAIKQHRADTEARYASTAADRILWAEIE